MSFAGLCIACQRWGWSIVRIFFVIVVISNGKVSAQTGNLLVGLDFHNLWEG